MQLYIGNKNYSSWSMRPWVLMRHYQIPFDEVMVRFDDFHGSDSAFKQRVAQVTPTGRVPVLVDDGFAVWDTLAIAEYLAERFPQHPLWPREPRARARARSLCAEMHAGFSSLRSHCPQNIEAVMPQVGQRVLREQSTVRDDRAGPPSRVSAHASPVCTEPPGAPLVTTPLLVMLAAWMTRATRSTEMRARLGPNSASAFANSAMFG